MSIYTGTNKAISPDITAKILKKSCWGNMTWSEIDGGGWSKLCTHSNMLYWVRFYPYSIIFASCHILLKLHPSSTAFGIFSLPP